MRERATQYAAKDCTFDSVLVSHCRYIYVNSTDRKGEVAVLRVHTATAMERRSCKYVHLRVDEVVAILMLGERKGILGYHERHVRVRFAGTKRNGEV
jgi:hypothetical protein